jgi:hypothetical protein
MKKFTAIFLVAAALVTGVLSAQASQQAIFNDGEPLLVEYK